MADGRDTAPPVHKRQRGPRAWAEPVRHLDPGYFALVMATGIVSAALRDTGRPTLSAVLLILAIVCLAVLVIALVVRLALFPRKVGADLSAPDRAFAFFSFVAAFGILADRLAEDGHRTPAAALGLIAALAWLGLTYGVPVRLVLGPHKGPVLKGVNGTWFLWVVGTQSLAVVSAALGTAYPEQARPFALAAVVAWSTGVVLYLLLTAVTLIRLLLLPVRPEELKPQHWVMMGAAAITVLAAARILRMPWAPLVGATGAVLAGLAVVLWSFGTWMIPMLLVFEAGRSMVRRFRLEYESPLWSTVFPLGMYAASGIELGRLMGAAIVEGIGLVWVWIAFPAWMITFAAMLLFLLNRWRARPAGTPGRPGTERERDRAAG